MGTDRNGVERAARLSPLLTRRVFLDMQNALRSGAATLECSLDLDRSREPITLEPRGWVWRGNRYPFPERCKERTIYYWRADRFEPIAHYGNALIKLVPTEWGPPTFEIDGIKMLPTAHVSPYEDALAKVRLIEPRGKTVLDTCGGLGYFAACCLSEGAMRVSSYEKHADVLWLRTLNPWSPPPNPRLSIAHADVTAMLPLLAPHSVDAILHDPPRFGIAGELYSQHFYDQLARVLKPHGKLLHYTGTPNKLTSGRDVPAEVAARLRRSGFAVDARGDSLLAVNRARGAHP